MSDCDFGLIGLAVMGENLALNIESRGYRVAVFNRIDRARSTTFIGGRAAGQATSSAATRSRNWSRQSGVAAQGDDAWSRRDRGRRADRADAAPLLSPGRHRSSTAATRTTRTPSGARSTSSDRACCTSARGVSGGEEGALKGPSMMPGGSAAAWPLRQPIFQAIAAKVGPNNDIPCCEWVGPRGAGHYVKMVHNGIEYGDMQLICEAYYLLQELGGLDNDELYDVFDDVEPWRAGELPDRDHPRHLQRPRRPRPTASSSTGFSTSPGRRARASG